jgi:phage gpG-like protein
MARARDVISRLNRQMGGGLASTVDKEFARAALQAESRAKINATQRLKVRSGALRASIKGTSTGAGLTRALRLQAGGPAVPYAAAQEFGGTIYPRQAKALAIPLQERLRGISPKNLGEPDTFILMREGKPYIVQDTGNKGLGTGSGLVFLYRLVSSVTLRPTFYLRDAFKETLKELRDRIQKAVAKAVAGRVT